MPSLAQKLFAKPETQAAFLRLKVFWVGLARDFWKDGSLSKENKPVSARKKPSNANDQASEEKPAFWTADRIQIMERMWGEGMILPGDEAYLDSLITPLGLTKEMSVLDLAAGLGGMARKIARDFGSYVTGFEIDGALAARGMIMSIAAGKAKQATVSAYDPAGYEATRKYDSLFARELFYRVTDKARLFQAVGSSLKSGGSQVVLTDYLLDPSHEGHPDIVEWKRRESDAAPMELHVFLQFCKDLGLNMRVAEDQTDLHRREILKGLGALLLFLQENAPDTGTKKLLLQEIAFWATRLAALKAGLKYYRFYGIKY